MKVEFEIQTKPENDILERKQCNNPEMIFSLPEVQAIKNAIQEHFLFIGLDKKNNINAIRLLGVGNCNSINIDFKDIARTALLTASEKVIFVHNHPSEVLVPSNADRKLTNYANKILNILNIEFLDHIIVSNKEYHSMGKYKEIDFDFTDDKLNLVDKILLEEENNKLKDEVKKLNRKFQKNINDR